MQTLWSLTKRNMLIYLKDKSAVFFSLLSALLIIGLYAIFLTDNNIRNVQAIITAKRQTIAYLVNSWVMAGIIVVNTVTVTLGVIGIMIDDEQEKRLASFLVAPVSRAKLVLGYILAAFIVGNILATLTLILAELYIAGTGGALLGLGQILKALGLIGISVFASTSTVFAIVTMVRSKNAFALLSTIIGTLIGFIAGIYLPVGILSPPVRNFIKCVPVFYSAALMREVFMTEPVKLVFKGAPESVIAHYLQTMGVTIPWHGVLISNRVKFTVILVSGVFFLILSVIIMSRRKTPRN